jgi:hypothetical protein
VQPPTRGALAQEVGGPLALLSRRHALGRDEREVDVGSRGQRLANRGHRAPTVVAFASLAHRPASFKAVAFGLAAGSRLVSFWVAPDVPARSRLKLRRSAADLGERDA